MSSFGKNKHVILITVVGILLIITIPTMYKVIKSHQNKLITAVEKEISEAAQLCYYKQDCKEKVIKLKTLYELNYLKKQVNPINKKVYDEDSSITINKKELVLDLH